MKKTIAIALCLIFIIAVAGCSDSKNRSKGVYMLLDTSGTYALELKKAQSILNYLLGVLQPGDTLAVARIDTGSFSEKDIVAKITFDERPSYANNEKRMFQQEVNTFVSTVKSSQYTDISGGILQAIEYLNERGAGQKHVLIFSDLKQELAKGYKRDIPFQLQGFNVIALNVTKLRADNIDPKKYQRRVTRWRAEIESGGGTWDIINDLENLDHIFAN
ncbi:MAG: VWA domain-containing protein [Deltaproteobacteria bacterium]|nr:VWA domain-containing protein [Deltaproteobacteria bacterium]